MGVHGHGCGALGGVKDVRGSASFEDCETVFRYLRCIRQGCVEAPVLWDEWCHPRVVESGREMDGQRLGSDDYRFSCMMWEENCWIFSYDWGNLKNMVNGITDELTAGNGAQTWVIVMDEYVQGRRRVDIGGGRQGERLGDAFRGSFWRVGVSVWEELEG